MGRSAVHGMIFHRGSRASFAITVSRKFAGAVLRLSNWRVNSMMKSESISAERLAELKLFQKSRGLIFSDHRQGGNNQKPTASKEAEFLLKKGFSIRVVCAATKLSKSTVTKIRKRIRTQIKAVCACGQATGHRGWCSVRVRQSPKRQKVIARWHSKTAEPNQPCSRRACPYPAVVNGICAAHLREAGLSDYPLGSTLGSRAMNRS